MYANVYFVSILGLSYVVLGTLGNAGAVSGGEASDFVTLGQYV